MNKKKFSVTNIGSISLLMIFIILCMVTLAALSLSSAASDENSANKFAEHTTQYYQADNQAEETLDIIDGILAESYVISSDSAAYFSEIETRLAKLNTTIHLNVSPETNSATIDYLTNVDDSQSLEVQLTLTDPWSTSSGNSSSGNTSSGNTSSGNTSSTSLGFYTITSWKEIQTKNWDADNTMKLIQ